MSSSDNNSYIPNQPAAKAELVYASNFAKGSPNPAKPCKCHSKRMPMSPWSRQTGQMLAQIWAQVLPTSGPHLPRQSVPRAFLGTQLSTQFVTTKCSKRQPKDGAKWSHIFVIYVVFSDLFLICKKNVQSSVLKRDRD